MVVVRDLKLAATYAETGHKTLYRAAELRPARLAVAAVGAQRDLAASDAGRTALLQRCQEVVTCVLPPLEAALTLKGMHQVQQRIDRVDLQSNRSTLLCMVLQILRMDSRRIVSYPSFIEQRAVPA